MSGKPAAADTALSIVRTFNAPRERVFDAFLDPKEIGAWIGPPQVHAEATRLEARVGGHYRIAMHGAEGTPTVAGVYREIKRPERLVFTWAWEGAHEHGVPGGESVVTVIFREVAGKTEVTLRHEALESAESRDSHNQGWGASLDKLAALLAKHK